MRRHRLDAIHARSHVPAATGLIVRRLTGCRLIFDIRGLLADEYVDAGAGRAGDSPSGSPSASRRRRSPARTRSWSSPSGSESIFDASPDERVTVIPCCADLDRVRRGSGRRRAGARSGRPLRPLDHGLCRKAHRAVHGSRDGRVLRHRPPSRSGARLPGLDAGAARQHSLRVRASRYPDADYRILRAEPAELGSYLSWPTSRSASVGPVPRASPRRRPSSASTSPPGCRWPRVPGSGTWTRSSTAEGSA